MQGSTAPTSAFDAAWQYGVLGVVCLLCIIVIQQLYKRLTKKDDEFAAERRVIQEERIKQDHAHELEIAKLRGEYEAKLRANAEAHTEAIRTEMKLSRDREDMIRREFAETVDAMASKTVEAANATRLVLDKIYDRFLGQRR